MKRRLHLPVVLCIAALGCAPAADTSGQLDEQATIDTLAALANRFSSLFVEGDAAGMTDLYTDDAVLFPGNSDYIRGREAIEQYWTLAPGRRITNHKITPVDFDISDSLASDFGYYEISGENDGQSWGPSHGKYVIVWKRGRDGRWRMHLDMWNSMPAPAP